MLEWIQCHVLKYSIINNKIERLSDIAYDVIFGLYAVMNSLPGLAPDIGAHTVGAGCLTKC